MAAMHFDDGAEGRCFSRDLSLVPNISFGFVEAYIGKYTSGSGKEQMTKGFKYYSESYIHSIAVYRDDTGCLVKGKCFRSQRKNESPHDIKVLLNGEKVEYAMCSCTIGLSGSCGHVTALLYQLANYKKMNFQLVPTDVAKTSLPQTWHVPRGEKLKGDKVDNIVVQGYDRKDPHRATKGIKSTLYNPILDGSRFDCDNFLKEIQDLDIIFGTVITPPAEEVQTQYGKFPKGSILSYQQKMSTDYLLNLIDVNDFPLLPVNNTMCNSVPFVLNNTQHKTMYSLNVNSSESVEIEENTRDQSSDPRWHKLRSNRITASNAGDIAKRRADGKKLAERLQAARSYQSAAMKRGIDSESTAAHAYSKKMDDCINLYPCGVVVSPYCPWLAATPDRKVYCPSRDPPFGLLEIKCPNTNDWNDVKCLKKENDVYSLKMQHNYYYQVQMQMAVTGLTWCDFFVWLENDCHLETVYFDAEFWQETKDKLDLFYLNYYLG